MASTAEPVEADIFSGRHAMRGTWFTARGATSSGLFSTPDGCSEWTYFHYENGRYAIPVWERLEIAGDGALAEADDAAMWGRLNAWTRDHAVARDLDVDGFGAVARGASGTFFVAYTFPSLQTARDFAAELGGRWVLAALADRVSMF